MDRFCRALHPDLDLSSTCLSWFHQATEHCTELILRKNRGSVFWRLLNKFIFINRQRSLVNQKIPISIHPDRLSLNDCNALHVEIVNDYLVHAPRYTIEAATNILLWQILFSLFGVFVLCVLLAYTISAYRKYGQSIEKPLDPIASVFLAEKRINAYINRNLRQVKYELRLLHVRHSMKPEDILSPSGTTTFVIIVSSKLNVKNGTLNRTAHCKGRLYRLTELQPKVKPVYKIQPIAKMMRFINKYSCKLRLRVIFDEEPSFEEVMQQRQLGPRKTFSPLTLPPLTNKKSLSRLSMRSNASRSNSPPKNKVCSARLSAQMQCNLPRRLSSVMLKK
ncbi:PREDICTED: uncharacterized protein LOC108363806 [Rhagoletis zephyria]|uniref:uncharacterized protein LOC108363806 n=1 Tax=Rhagoletis zephyria TaxID=28612 RepID=UPI000811A69D|nr:PREDICTED: uncharacterized protein LOC108363806 [Rhagoletis zephyria]